MSEPETPTAGPRLHQPKAKARRNSLSAKQHVALVRFLIQMERELAAERYPPRAVAERAAKELGFPVSHSNVRRCVEHGAVPRWWDDAADRASRLGGSHVWSQLKSRVEQLTAALAAAESASKATSARVETLEAMVNRLAIELGVPAAQAAVVQKRLPI